MEAGQGGEQDDDAAEHDDHADDLVDELDAVGAELRAYLVDEPRKAPPPQECAADDAYESCYHLAGVSVACPRGSNSRGFSTRQVPSFGQGGARRVHRPRLLHREAPFGRRSGLPLVAGWHARPHHVRDLGH